MRGNACWKTCETRQRKKFALLQERSKPNPANKGVIDVDNEDQKNIKERWVINKSDRELSPSELSVLQKGLNFSVVPNDIPTAEFV